MDKEDGSARKFDDIDFEKLDITQIIDLCLKCESKEDANKVLVQYEQYCDSHTIARENLGYIFGYCDPDSRKKLYALFPVDHPIFGPQFGRGSDPSIEDAFKIGKIIGEKMKKRYNNVLRTI